MAKSLQELAGELQDEQLPTAGEELDDLPQFGGWTPPPPPGMYRFRLPTDMQGIWDTFPTPEKRPPQRVKMILDQEHPLTITQSPGGKHNGEPFTTRLTNNERKRGRGGAVVASDFDYLLRAFKETTKPRSNGEYIKAMQKHAGKEFGGDIRYSWRCDKTRDVRVRDSQGQIQVIDGKPGCGATYYQDDVSKGQNGEVPFEVTCEDCGALLRAFANLDNIRS
jgi:hypothetical protein